MGSLFRNTGTYVIQARSVGVDSVLWYGPHTADATIFLPLPQRTTVIPEPYRIGHPAILNRGSAYWAHRYVFNVAKIKYNCAMRDVHATQRRLESAGSELIAHLDELKTVEQIEINGNVSALARRIFEDTWALPDI